jgi:hypothetical protein
MRWVGGLKGEIGAETGEPILWDINLKPIPGEEVDKP